MPTDAAVVRAAVDAAEAVIFSRYDRADIDDIDVGVAFSDDQLSIDIYLNVPDEDAEQVVDDAALAARAAVDDLLEEPSDA